MKKKRITYGVSGMMEYQTVIRFGKNILKVTFTGGSMNAIGVTPATFTTTNFLIQKAIENSCEFKRGRIRIVKTMELDEEIHIERGAPFVAAVPEKSADAGSAHESVCEHTVQGTETGTNVTAASAEEPLPEDEDAGSMTQVEFSCNDDAKDYLEQTFGFVRSKLRNREDIVNAGKSHNVEIIFV